MNFVQPSFLWGLLAAAVPLLVHLFDRRRPKRVPFGAIAFVLRSQRRSASRLRLKKIVLFVTRTSILVALPLALARPSCEQTQAAATAEAAATVLVVDTSFAGRLKDSGGQLFEKVKREAKLALAELQTQEPVVLLECGAHPQPPGLLGFERTSVARAIDALTVSFEAADYNLCLSQAARALEDSPLPARRIVLVGPLWTQSLRLDGAPPTSTDANGKAAVPQLVLRPVVDEEKLSNLALSGLSFGRAVQGQPKTWQFVATVRNFGVDSVQNAELQLLVDGVSVSKAFVDVAAGASAQKTFSHRFLKGGTQVVEVRLASDALNDDNLRQVVVTVPKELQVLVVNGSPNGQKLKDEAFFVDAALADTASPVRALVREPESAFREAFENYAAVFLLNTEPPAPEVAKRLEAFVRAGGGLFVSFGDRLTAENLDQWNAVLARRIRVVKTASEANAVDVATRAARFQQVTVTHPVLAPFVGRAREGLVSTRFFRYALFETAAEGDVLATLDDGAAALWTAPLGAGRMLVFASSVDTEWTDFPIRTAFLPFIQRAAAFLTSNLEDQTSPEGRVGQMLTLSGRVPAEAVAARGPEQSSVNLQRVAAQPAQVGPFSSPGVYGLIDGKGEVLEAWRFPVQLAPNAGDVARHSVEAVKSWFGSSAVSVSGASGQRPATPVWTWLLLALVVAFAVEGFVIA